MIFARCSCFQEFHVMESDWETESCIPNKDVWERYKRHITPNNHGVHRWTFRKNTIIDAFIMSYELGSYSAYRMTQQRRKAWRLKFN